MIRTDMGIDWAWVENILFKKERITPKSPGGIFDISRKSVRRARELADPRVRLIKEAVASFDAGSIKLACGAEFSGATLSSYIKGAKYVYLFLITIGSSIEDEASRLMKKKESLPGYLLDRAGSFAVESLADGLEIYLRKDHKLKDESISMRFSPGYCDWPLEEQTKLDKLLDFSGIGVRLTEGCMMVPRKSISGLMGIGQAKLFSKTKSQCEICNMKVCAYRRN